MDVIDIDELRKQQQRGRVDRGKRLKEGNTKRSTPLPLVQPVAARLKRKAPKRNRTAGAGQGDDEAETDNVEVLGEQPLVILPTNQTVTIPTSGFAAFASGSSHAQLSPFVKGSSKGGIPSRIRAALTEAMNCSTALEEELEEGKKKLAASEKKLAASEEKTTKYQSDYDVLLKKFESLTSTHDGCSRMLADKEEKLSILGQEKGKLKEAVANAGKQALEEYKSGPQYHADLGKQALAFYDDGVNHTLRVAAGSGYDLEILYGWKLEEKYGESARRGHPWVPYSETDMATIRKKDLESKKPEWVPPPINTDNLNAYLGMPENDGYDGDEYLNDAEEQGAEGTGSA